MKLNFSFCLSARGIFHLEIDRWHWHLTSQTVRVETGSQGSWGTHSFDLICLLLLCPFLFPLTFGDINMLELILYTCLMPAAWRWLQNSRKTVKCKHGICKTHNCDFMSKGFIKHKVNETRRKNTNNIKDKQQDISDTYCSSEIWIHWI